MDTPLSPQQELDQVHAAELDRRNADLPVDPGLVLRRARLLESLGRIQEALAACDEAAEAFRQQGFPPQGSVANLRGLVMFRLRNYEESLNCFNDAERLFNGQSEALPPALFIHRAALLDSMGRYEDALRALDTAAQLSEEQGSGIDPGLYGNRGLVLANLCRYHEALEAFDQAEQRSNELGMPVFPGLANNRGNALENLGRYDEALQAYDECERLMLEMGMPIFPGLPVNRGIVYGRQGQHERALEEYAESERTFLGQGMQVPPLVATFRAISLGKLGRFDEAMETYGLAEQQLRDQGMEEDWQLFFQRAITLYEAGRASEAIAQVYRAILVCGRQKIEPPAFVMESLQDWLSPNPSQLATQQKASQPDAVQAVPDNEKTHDAFLSYRRDPGLPYSMLIKTHLGLSGKTVFRDQDDLHRGRFLDELREAIRHSRYLIVLLTPGFLDRCRSDHEDVVRLEIATALRCGTHIIPVMMEGFAWPKPDELPEDIRAITGINAMSYSTEFFTAFIDKLLKWME